MAIKINTKYQNAFVDNVGRTFMPPHVDIFSGEAPVNADASTTGALLVTFTGDEFFWSYGSNGTSSLPDPRYAYAIADGTFGYARIRHGDSLIIQGNVGVSATSDVQLDAGTCASGDYIALEEIVFYQGAS